MSGNIPGARQSQDCHPWKNCFPIATKANWHLSREGRWRGGRGGGENGPGGRGPGHFLAEGLLSRACDPKLGPLQRPAPSELHRAQQTRLQPRPTKAQWAASMGCPGRGWSTPSRPTLPRSCRQRLCLASLPSPQAEVPRCPSLSPQSTERSTTSSPACPGPATGLRPAAVRTGRGRLQRTRRNLGWETNAMHLRVWGQLQTQHTIHWGPRCHRNRRSRWLLIINAVTVASELRCPSCTAAGSGLSPFINISPPPAAAFHHHGVRSASSTPRQGPLVLSEHQCGFSTRLLSAGPSTCPQALYIPSPRGAAGPVALFVDPGVHFLSFVFIPEGQACHPGGQGPARAAASLHCLEDTGLSNPGSAACWLSCILSVTNGGTYRPPCRGGELRHLCATRSPYGPRGSSRAAGARGYRAALFSDFQSLIQVT